jgi:hypothetical protein
VGRRSRNEHIVEESGREDCRISGSARRPHFRICRHDSVLAGLAVLAVVLDIGDRNYGLPSKTELSVYATNVASVSGPKLAESADARLMPKPWITVPCEGSRIRAR